MIDQRRAVGEGECEGLRGREKERRERVLSGMPRVQALLVHLNNFSYLQSFPSFVNFKNRPHLTNFFAF